MCKDQLGDERAWSRAHEAEHVCRKKGDQTWGQGRVGTEWEGSPWRGSEQRRNMTNLHF